MRQITTEELFRMEVINLCDGARLGCTSALELCAEDGRITALVIPRECSLFSFGKGERYRIPWCRIQCIGEDTVLVKLTDTELSDCLLGGRGKKR
jgi:YlmC/YmxH family sporulation protein